MPPKIFLTGATGYIGGDVLQALYHDHPDYDYTLLIRSEAKAQAVQKAFQKVRIVLGGLDDSQILQDEAAKADIVLHTADASDHEGAAKAIAAGLLKGHSKDRPGYWLHTGGTGILTYQDSDNNFEGLGTWSDKEYNDWTKVDELTSLPDHAFHRNIDKLVLDVGVTNPDVVKTVIVCPPTIYGRGRGPGSQRGRQLYEMASLILKRQIIPVVGQGQSRWNNIHVADLTEVFKLLVDRAVDGDANNTDIWGKNGYILTENGEHLWTDVAKKLASIAENKGYIKSAHESPLSKDEALEAAGFEAVSWGLNSRGKAERAAKALGWKPTRVLDDYLDEIIEDEHLRSS
ncbi:hypothetical protein PV10_01074 [Exophiala mesophila]|uniref:NAD(P)-binding domain-containing protein n=1 Tax=Exophiala mesophila TaxID=212818 RepID=A0A0D1ZRT2_EXOME|nr:uncharacterized protein PV10_01074 [Exophiala mesophila]KIV97312.1 hypothetical protein PV10_01074 [Exophiala mesophila]